MALTVFAFRAIRLSDIVVGEVSHIQRYVSNNAEKE